MHNTEENIKKIRSQIKQFEQQYHREPDSVKLMAVSKKKPVELIEQAFSNGQTIFGESYVQEALEKIERLKNLKTIDWHFIGPIQSNKTRDIAGHFNWVHSVDRSKIIKRLSDQRDVSLSPLNICLQVNIDGEETKSGFKPEQLMDAAQEVINSPQLTLRGLMAIPAPSSDLSVQREAFLKVKNLYEKLQTLSDEVDTLSIGMSGDIEAAIAEGSTMVRIGTAIFGQRQN